MTTPTPPQPVKLIVGMLSKHREAFALAERALVERYGPVDLASEIFPFDLTDYYEPEMGRGIERKFLSFERLISPGDIAAIKIETNALEESLAREIASDVPRPINLDPGYISLSKLVLASTKDYTHRLYLSDGIYAEITLEFHKGRFHPGRWTFPDYKADTYHPFLTAVRDKLHDDRRQASGPKP